MNSFQKHFKLDEKTAIEYVRQKTDYFSKDSKLTCKEIGDGNINYVFKIFEVDSKKSLILKQADKLLRSSQRPLDVERNKIEAQALMLQYDLSKKTPKIYFYDEVMSAIVMEDVSDFENMRIALLKRKIYPNFANQITDFLVDTLLKTSDLVLDRAKKKDLVKNFINKQLCDISEDLVFTEPYIDYKNRNIITNGNEEFVELEIYKDEKLKLEASILKHKFMNYSQSLIHGDLHTGSIFVKKDDIKVLDPEFAFYGPMGYDVGNVIGNLFFAYASAVSEDPKNEEFLSWIKTCIEDIFNLFLQKLSKSYDLNVCEIMAKNNNFKNWILEEIKNDSISFSGLEMIRRVVGDSKVLDITQINEKKARIRVERVLILTAKEFILNRKSISTGQELVSIFTQKCNQNLNSFV